MVEDEVKEWDEVVRVEDEWVAVVWALAEIADAHSVAIQCLIKLACPVSSKPVPNAGLKWRDPERNVLLKSLFRRRRGKNGRK